MARMDIPNIPEYDPDLRKCQCHTRVFVNLDETWKKGARQIPNYPDKLWRTAKLARIFRFGELFYKLKARLLNLSLQPS